MKDMSARQFIKACERNNFKILPLGHLNDRECEEAGKPIWWGFILTWKRGQYRVNYRLTLANALEKRAERGQLTVFG